VDLTARVTFERQGPANHAANYYWHRKRREVLRLIQRNVSKMSDVRRVVELGCGPGQDMVLLRDALDHLDARFEGVEAAPECLARARARVAALGLDDITFREADVTRQLPYGDGSVCLVYCSEVLEHLPNAAPVVSEIARVLRPGGFALITTPSEPNPFQASFYLRRRIERHRRQLMESPRRLEDGTPLYGHVGLKTFRAWDGVFSAQGLSLEDAARGPIWYGGSSWMSNDLVLPEPMTFRTASNSSQKP